MAVALTQRRLLTLKIGTSLGLGIARARAARGAIRKLMSAVPIQNADSIVVKRLALGYTITLTVRAVPIRLEANAASGARVRRGVRPRRRRSRMSDRDANTRTEVKFARPATDERDRLAVEAAGDRAWSAGAAKIRGEGVRRGVRAREDGRGGKRRPNVGQAHDGMTARFAAKPERDQDGRADLPAARTAPLFGAGGETSADRLLALQRTAGNRAVARLVGTERSLSRAPAPTDAQRRRGRGLKVTVKADHDMRGDEVGIAVLEQIYGDTPDQAAQRLEEWKADRDQQLASSEC